MKKNILLLFFSGLLAIFGAEIFLIVFNNTYPTGLKNKRILAARNSGIVYDARNSAHVINEYTEKGINAYPDIRPDQLDASPYFNYHNYNVFPLAGISNSLIVQCNEDGQWKTIKTDEFGFNNPSEAIKTYPKTIHLIGDSYTAGYCVPESNEISSYLDNPNYKILNLGVGGNDPLLEFATYKEYSKHLKPDIIIWNYFEGNDLEGLHIRLKNKTIRKYLNNNFSQNLKKRQIEIDIKLKNFVNIRLAQELTPPWHNNKTISFFKVRNIRGLILKAFRKQYVCTKEDFDNFTFIIDTVRHDVESWGGEFYLSYLPSWERYSTAKENHSCSLKYYKKVKRFAEQKNIKLIDIVEKFDSHPDPLSLFNFRLNGHYNKTGYHVMGNTIDSTIKNARNYLH